MEQEVAVVIAYMKEDSGYVCCAIYNILSEIAPEKVIAIYKTAALVLKDMFTAITNIFFHSTRHLLFRCPMSIKKDPTVLIAT